MILIPEIKTVVILVPRTGTRSLKRAIADEYPNSMLLYRHMEADGVPHGYDRWRKVGVVRDPLDRLWSLYKYLKRFGLDWCAEHDATYTAKMRESVEAPFEDWLLKNDLPFTTPYDSAGLGRFFPAYSVKHPIPENRKSQFHYLRPDLGTDVFPYQSVGNLYSELGVMPPRLNGTDDQPPPQICSDAVDYISRWFAWDKSAVDAKP
ncbi:MAG: hypothetical protein II336_17900 [Loktanella sp.]|nr:hypothetical protein [Loktanella sp.]